MKNTNIQGEIILLFIVMNACYAVDNSLVLSMHLDNNAVTGETPTWAADSSSYGNNGIISGASWTTAGNVGSSISFDGINDYVSIPNSASLNIAGSTPYSISMWVKGIGTLNEFETLVTKQPFGSCSGGYFMYYYKGEQNPEIKNKIGFGFSYACSQESVIYSTKTDWNQNTWYHLAGTWDGTTNTNSLKLYVNGELNAQATAQYPTIMQNTANLGIGAWTGTLDGYFKGQIDEIKIYERALTAEEVRRLYNQPDEFLVLNMHLDNNATAGDSSTKTADSSTYKNDGTITGTTWTTSSRIGSGATSFDGINDYVSLPNSASLNIAGSTPYSISMWVKGIGSSLNNWETLITKQPQGSCSGGYFMFYNKDPSVENKNKIGFAFAHACSQESGVYSTKTDWNQNTWYHLAGTWDGTTKTNSLKLYVNGELNAQATAQYPTILENTANLGIGAWTGTLDGYFKGQIDEIKIYERTLTAEEVKAQYDSAPTTTTTTTTSTTTTTPTTTTTTTTTTPTTTMSSTTSTIISSTSTTPTSTTTTTTILSNKVSVTRDLPLYGLLGSTLKVALSMDVNESNKPNAIGLTEYYPEGWNVSSVSLGGVLKTTPSRIEWLFSSLSNPVQDYAVNYTLIVPSTANGTYSFSGFSDTGNATIITTTGDTSLLVKEAKLSDVINIINDWADGHSSLSEVIDMITAWASTQ